MTLFKHALRQVFLRPGLSAAMIVMLALGIGATTAVSSLFYQLLVQPLAVPEPERLVNVVPAGPEGLGNGRLSYPMFRDLEAEQNVFTSLAAYNIFSVNLVYGTVATTVPAAVVSGGYFQVLDLQPSLGRLIGRQDEPRVDESPVVVLGHAFWQSRFGGDPSIVGETLTINEQSLTIIGVAPEGFTGTQLGERAQVFLPLTMRARLAPELPWEVLTNRRFPWVPVFARLRTGVTPDQASAGINAAYNRIRSEFEAPPPTATEEEIEQFRLQRLDLVPGARGQGSIPGAGRSLTLLLGVTLLVLLIVCVNIANLLLARGASRAGEMAIRESIGASRGRLLAQLLTETAVPAVIGGVLSLPVAAMTLRVIMPIFPADLTDGLAVGLGTEAVVFAAAATVSTALVVGIFPALRATRAAPAAAIKGQGSQAFGGRGLPRIRNALVTVQIAFSMTLLALAGLFAQSLLNVARIDLGIDIDSLVSFTLGQRRSKYTPEEAEVLLDRIVQAVAAEPGVTAVAYAANPLLSGGDTLTAAEGFENVAINLVGPEFFRTVGIPLIQGREFTETDDQFSGVAIVNERFARQYRLDGNAIGQRMGLPPFGEPEIVGVVADAAYGNIKGQVPPQVFRLALVSNPLTFFSPTVYVRTSLDPNVLLTAIPRVVASVDSTLPLTHLATMRRLAQENVFADRLVTILSASFALLATLLAAIGLYGLVAYNIATRTRELGLRLALGAAPAKLRALILKQLAWMTLIGLALGLVAAVGFGRSAQALLYGVSGHDPQVLAAAAAVLAAVVFAATCWPVRRASRIAPMEALRYE